MQNSFFVQLEYEISLTIRTEFSILHVYRKIEVKENPYSGIAYAVRRLVYFKMFQNFWKAFPRLFRPEPNFGKVFSLQGD